MKPQSDKNIYSLKSKALDKCINSINHSAPHESIGEIELMLNSNSSIIPVAQSNIYYAAAKKVTGLNADMYQGHIDLFRLNK